MQDHATQANQVPRPNEAPQQPRPAVTEPHSGSTGQLATAGARRGVRVAGRWYYVVTIATAGTFAWVPFLHAARRLKSSKAHRLLLIYVGLDALMYVLAAITPQNSQGQTAGAAGNAVSAVGGLLALGIIIVGCIQQAPLRRMVFEGAPSDGEEHQLAVDPAVKAVLAARARRDEARQLAAGDPLLARELHIGRPDMSRDYDDGGLIDLNSAPAPLIAEVCGIPAATAASIVDARTQRGEPFSNVDELFVMADLPVSTWDRIRDRAVLIP
jgi:DNA uptake protein ComE-like DNA-binding protein